MKYIQNAKKSIDWSVILIVIAGALFFWSSVSAGEPDYMTEYEVAEWVVSEGESLWSIASSHHHQIDLTIEQTLQWVKEKNAITGEAIYPGQKLYLPVEVKAVAAK
ncbi:LysM peptidoglycan-binding domain-containing protein [Evansella sp. LMS18]|jgi:hypothetical protein|uniref:cell division suppressor protein YneA n=1 Tax=Evansella sp. LMS18 TaxID=2924033 RepID=UPI0020D18DEC|nr:LysM peptidoglycan-binding domain-containing protein [Evansella sp. LMS18]UTR10777.1 LysM peptidoglycan-binding domain-containing protein [Evansella sp. LMS18]